MLYLQLLLHHQLFSGKYCGYTMFLQKCTMAPILHRIIVLVALHALFYPLHQYFCISYSVSKLVSIVNK